MKIRGEKTSRALLKSDKTTWQSGLSEFEVQDQGDNQNKDHDYGTNNPFVPAHPP